MTVKEILGEAEQKMKNAWHGTLSEFGGVRTGRASPALFDRVVVDYYGTKTPLRSLATITVPEPQLAVIQPYDKAALPDMEKAILQSDLGLTPSNDGNLIRVAFPPLTEERRKELGRVVRKITEEGRVKVRNVRRDAKERLQKLKKDGELSEDDEFRGEEELQKLTDKFIHEIDEGLKAKEAEIMEV